jgi:hypothetical protein
MSIYTPPYAPSSFNAYTNTYNLSYPLVNFGIIDTSNTNISNVLYLIDCSNSSSNNIITYNPISTLTNGILSYMYYSNYTNTIFTFPNPDMTFFINNGLNYDNSANQNDFSIPSVITTTTTSNFAVQYIGYFKPNQTGNWLFNIITDDIAMLWIGQSANNPSLSNYFCYNTTPNNSSGYITINGNTYSNGYGINSIYLMNGLYYKFLLNYGQGGNGYNFTINITPPNSVTPLTDISNLLFNNNDGPNTFNDNTGFSVNDISLNYNNTYNCIVNSYYNTDTNYLNPSYTRGLSFSTPPYNNLKLISSTINYFDASFTLSVDLSNTSVISNLSYSLIKNTSITPTSITPNNNKLYVVFNSLNFNTPYSFGIYCYTSPGINSSTYNYKFNMIEKVKL